MNENFFGGYTLPPTRLLVSAETISELKNLETHMYQEKITSQTSAEAAIKGNLFIIGTVDSAGIVSFSSTPTIHMTTAHARAECKRLAQRTPDKTFFYVQLKGAERTVSQPTSVSI
jgi:hypothetical protein